MEHLGKPVALDYRPTPRHNAVPGSDSNASSRKGLFVTTEHSPRGIRTGGWQLFPHDGGPRRDPGPREGVLERRSVPPLEQRKYYSKIAPPFDTMKDYDSDDDYNPEDWEENDTSENSNEDDASESDEEDDDEDDASGGDNGDDEIGRDREDDKSDDDDEEGDITGDAGEDDVNEDAKREDERVHPDENIEVREG